MSLHEIFQNLNETQKVQRIMLTLPVTDDYFSSISFIANMAGVKDGIAKKTLHTADCMDVKRTGGPTLFRKEKDPNTVRKIFDAVTEPWQEWEIPIKCRNCRFANTGTMTTESRNKDTVSGCIILAQRKSELYSQD